MINNIFDSLFVSVASEWPEEVDMAVMTLHQNGMYSVVGLYDISEHVSDLYIGKYDEIIKRSLNDAIYSALHEVAATCISVRPLNLRRDIVRKKFEERLADAMSNPSLGWDEQDIVQAKAYFQGEVMKHP